MRVKLQLVTAFMWTSSVGKREGSWIESCALVCCVQSTVTSTGNLDSSPCSHLPELVFPHAAFLFMRNSHVFPEAPHLEGAVQLPLGPGVTVGAGVKHPGRSRHGWAAGWGSVCRRAQPSHRIPSTLRPGCGSPLDRLSSPAQCARLSLTHLG